MCVCAGRTQRDDDDDARFAFLTSVFFPARLFSRRAASACLAVRACVCAHSQSPAGALAGGNSTRAAAAPAHTPLWLAACSPPSAIPHVRATRSFLFFVVRLRAAASPFAPVGLHTACAARHTTHMHYTHTCTHIHGTLARVRGAPPPPQPFWGQKRRDRYRPDQISE